MRIYLPGSTLATADSHQQGSHKGHQKVDAWTLEDYSLAMPVLMDK